MTTSPKDRDEMSLVLPSATTGSYGCVLCLRDDQEASLMTNLLRLPSVTLYRHRSGGNNNLIKKETKEKESRDEDGHEETVMDIDAFLEFLRDQGSVLAVKVFRARIDATTRTTRGAFLQELSVATRVRDLIGTENFNMYTTYKFYEGSCGFSVRIDKKSNDVLTMRHKPDFEAQAVDEVFFMLHEACSTNIENMASRRQPVDVSELDECLTRILRVLHGAGVVHRDIKPQNIVHCPFSPVRYKLVDYAFAEFCKSEVGGRRLPTVAGTRAYLSPYLVACASVEKGSYALGVKTMAQSLGSKKLKRFFLFLVRCHLVSVRRSKHLGTPWYALVKSDEYAYMVTLLKVYEMTRDPSILARALAISLTSNHFFC
jgi:serine/threonine protein kinase